MDLFSTAKLQQSARWYFSILLQILKLGSIGSMAKPTSSPQTTLYVVKSPCQATLASRDASMMPCQATKVACFGGIYFVMSSYT